MNRKLTSFARLYQTALRAHLKRGRRAKLETARGLGAKALAAGFETLDLARLHEQTLVDELLPGCPGRKRAGLIKQAGIFFAAAITPIESVHRSAREAGLGQRKLIETLSRRTTELAASNRDLNLEITRRKSVEEGLKKSERHYSQSLKHSARLQEQLRRLSRRTLSAQENERKRISRELHDVIAQTLTGINIRLAMLKKEAAHNTRGLDRNIARTQKLVEKSVNIVHRFARELRPAVLDDLGLIPALHSFMKSFTERTGIRTALTASAEVEKLDTARRTALFRVAQEALTNVGRHSRASRADVKIRKVQNRIQMQVSDDGKSFNVERTSRGKGGKRLGLLGMRERLEMVGGNFDVESAPGKGTVVTAQIPFGKPRALRNDL